MKNIAVIPARSGSKGLKDKNIRSLYGKPLIAYSIEAAINSGIYDVVHVSTDSAEYAKIAQQYGADVPFLRDKQLARDDSSTWEAMKYVVEQYKNNRRHPYVVLMILKVHGRVFLIKMQI